MERQDEPLSERVVKEAVSVGMETSMRDSILEAVEEADGGRGGGGKLPLAGALLAIGAAIGYLAGSKRTPIDAEQLPIDRIEAPEVISDVSEVTGGEPDVDEATGEELEEPEAGAEADGETGGGRLRRIAITLGIVGAVVLLRRRLASSEEEEWEPIEEFEPAVDVDAEAEAEGEHGTGTGTETDEESAPVGEDESEE